MADLKAELRPVGQEQEGIEILMLQKLQVETIQQNQT